MIKRLRWKMVGINMAIVTAVLLTVFASVFFISRAGLARESTLAFEEALQTGTYDPLTPGQAAGSRRASSPSSMTAAPSASAAAATTASTTSRRCSPSFRTVSTRRTTRASCGIISCAICACRPLSPRASPSPTAPASSPPCASAAFELAAGAGGAGGALRVPAICSRDWPCARWSARGTSSSALSPTRRTS